MKIVLLLLVGAVHADDIIYRCQYGSRVEYQAIPCERPGARVAVLFTHTLRGTVSTFNPTEAGFRAAAPAPSVPAHGGVPLSTEAEIDRLAARRNALAANPVSRALQAPGAGANAAGSDVPRVPEESPGFSFSDLWAGVANFFSGLWSGVLHFFGMDV